MQVLAHLIKGVLALTNLTRCSATRKKLLHCRHRIALGRKTEKMPNSQTDYCAADAIDR
jgi:hypothetical protein